MPFAADACGPKNHVLELDGVQYSLTGRGNFFFLGGGLSVAHRKALGVPAALYEAKGIGLIQSSVTARATSVATGRISAEHLLALQNTGSVNESLHCL